MVNQNQSNQCQSTLAETNTNTSNVNEAPPAEAPDTTGGSERQTMNGKPVLWRENTRTVLTDPSPAFGHKLLCDSLVFNTGDACAFSCEFCYVEGIMRRIDKKIVDAFNLREGRSKEAGNYLGFSDVVIRRSNVIPVLEGQLVKKDGTLRYPDPEDKRVVYSSTLVDVAANMDLLRETAAVCNLILTKTNWQIRLLSKSSLLARLPAMIPAEYHPRLIFGFSTGTLDPCVSRAIETGTTHVGSRIAALHALQDAGMRTFGMICPSLPQRDYEQFSHDICEAIRVDRCEHVWAEAINVRPGAMQAVTEGLRREGLTDEAEMMEAVHGPNGKAAWEEYARQTFLAHTRNIGPDKLRFLQYVTTTSAPWWAEQRANGAVLLGKPALVLGLLATETPSAPPMFY